MKIIMVLAVFVFTAVFAVPVGAVYAQADSPTPTNSDARPDVKPDVRSEVDIRPIDRCTVIEARIKKVIERLEKSVENKKQRYSEITQKVERIIKVAEQHEVDTEKLREALRVFNQKVDVFAVEASTLHDMLNKLLELACGDDRDTFKEQLQATRRQLKVVRMATADVRQYLSETLIPTAREVLSQLKALDSGAN